MKKTFLTLGLSGMLSLPAMATVLDWYSGTLNSTITDNSPVSSTFTTSGGTWTGGTWGSGQILDNTSGSISVFLNISGGYNNDLYGYLVYNDGAGTMTQVLLNRVTSPGAGFGGGATTDFASLQSAGVTLVDTAGSSIHTATPTAGQSYTPDSGATLNGTFGNMASGGTWTLFLADLAAGDQSTLVSWGLEVSVVPEPATWALIVFAALLGLAAGVRILRTRQTG
jgi:hypothetical protein